MQINWNLFCNFDIMTASPIPEDYFSEITLSHLKPQQRLSECYQRRALDVTLACKLTHVYGKFHLAMLHRELAMSEERMTYQLAERQAAMMNQITLFHSSPSDFMHTQEESTDESINTYKEFKQLVEEYSDEQFVPSIVEQFCKMVLYAPWLTPSPRLTGVLKGTSRGK